MEAPLCVEGTFSLREDEGAKVIVNKITELIENKQFEESGAKKSPSETPRSNEAINIDSGASKVFLRVKDMECLEYRRAKQIVDRSKGTLKVVFYDSASSKYMAYSQGFLPERNAVEELVRILGKDNVVFK